MILISIIGAGNVAQHLIKAFTSTNGVTIVQVFARNKDTVIHLIDEKQIISDYNDFKEADVYIIAVSDNAIASVSWQLPFQDKLVVHTSGSLAMNDLDAKNRRGILYPLQTFSKLKAVNFETIPIGIEAENTTDYKLLEAIASSISKNVLFVTSQQRKSLHVSAVFVCNFVNYLYQIGANICEEHGMPFEILHPLIQETALKIVSLSPQQAQTGPAKRNDTITINAHLNFLQDSNQKEIYKLLTKSIIDNGKEL